MTKEEAENVVEVLKDFIQHIIDENRPNHMRKPKSEDYREELIIALTTNHKEPA